MTNDGRQSLLTQLDCMLYVQGHKQLASLYNYEQYRQRVYMLNITKGKPNENVCSNLAI